MTDNYIAGVAAAATAGAALIGAVRESVLILAVAVLVGTVGTIAKLHAQRRLRNLQEGRQTQPTSRVSALG